MTTIDAHDDEDNRYTIHIRRSRIRTHSLTGLGAPVEGLRSYHLANGDALNRTNDEIFEIVATGKRLKVQIQNIEVGQAFVS